MRFAVYNITDDTIRLHLGCKPSEEEKDAMKEAGFNRYWPGRKLNVASWSPRTEDYVVQVLGLEIEADDMPDDPEDRADRFSGYAANAQRNADDAHSKADKIVSMIPFGQPILIGHHSEGRHRRHVERIHDYIGKSVAENDRAAYWRGRAAAALAHAAYKERPDVITRRIKKLQAEMRGIDVNMEHANRFLTMWNGQAINFSRDQAKKIANIDGRVHAKFTLAEYPRDHHEHEGTRTIWSALEDGIIDPEQARKLSVEAHTKSLKDFQRCKDHLQAVIEYQQALLIEMGGSLECKWEIKAGGRVQVLDHWYTVLRVTRKEGNIVSVTTDSKFDRIKNVETVTAYEPPTEEQEEAAKRRNKKPKICNYPGENFVHMTGDEFLKIPKDYKHPRAIESTKYEPHRVYHFIRHGRFEPVFVKDAKMIWPEGKDETPH